MASTVLNMILFKVLDIQDDETMQRKIKRQKTDINGRRKIFINL